MAFKILTILRFVFEAMLLFAAALIVATGVADGILSAYPAAGPCASAVVAGLLLWMAIASRGALARALDFRMAAGISVLALATTHAALNAGEAAIAGSPFFWLCFSVTVFWAASGSPVLWLSSILIMALVESAHVYLRHGGNPGEGLSRLLTAVCACASAGIIPYFLARYFLERAGRKPAPAAVGTTQPPAAPPASSAGPPQMPGVDSDSKRILLSPQWVDTGAYSRDQLLGTRTGDQEMEGILASVVFFMRRNFVAYSALAFIYNQQRQMLQLNSYHSKSISVIKDIEIPLGRGVVGRVGMERHTFMSGDVSLYAEDINYYSGNESINSVVAVPILSEDKELLGVLVIDSKDKRVFTDDHRDTLKRFSSLAAALITNARMRIFQQKVARNFQIFYETSHKFTTALKPDEVFDILLNEIAELTKFNRIMIATINYQKKTGVVYKIVGNSPDLQPGMEFPLEGGGIYAFAYQKGRPANIGDMAAYYRFSQQEPRLPHLVSLIVAPVLDDARHCIGLLSIEGDAPNQFAGDFEQIVSTLVENASVAIARALLYQKMEKLAATDGLTGLNNHRTFQEQLTMEAERSRRYARVFSLLLMDIDHFKSFNDTYGHPVGDLVLKEIANCIRRSIRINDIPARYGGEEFVVILPESNDQAAMITAERIRTTVESAVIRAADKDLRVTISLGCATFPQHSTDKAELIKFSDTALYFSKESGRNRVTAYQKGMVAKPEKH
jgi:diguanylate cyclase (GGDEF)-like protein